MAGQLRKPGAPEAPRGGSCWRDFHLEALGLGAVLAVAVTWPLVLRIGSHMPGSRLVGAYSHVWKYWWTWWALWVEGVNPAWSELVNYPRGLAVGYYTASFMNGIWTLPVTGTLGPVVSFDLMVLATLATGFWAAFLLGRRRGMGPGAASVAGLTWSLAPHHLGFVMGGAIENLGLPWVPLCLLALLELLDPEPAEGPRPTGRMAAWAGVVGVCLWLTAMTAWYGGLMLGVVAGVAWGWRALVDRRHRGRGLAWALAGLALGVVGVMISAHYLLPAVAEPRIATHWIKSAALSPLWMVWKRHETEAALSGTPGLWLNQHLHGVLALLAVAGLWHRRGRRWMLAAAPFLLDFALPNRWLRGMEAPMTGWSATVDTIILNLANDPERRVAPVHLLLAVSAGYGTVVLRDRVARWRRHLAPAVAPAVAVLWGLEAVFVNPVRLPVPLFEVERPAWTEGLRRPVEPMLDPSDRWSAGGLEGAVIDVPLGIESRDHANQAVKALRSRYVYYQVLHRRPVFTCVGTRLGYALKDIPVRDALLPLLTRGRILGPAIRQRWERLEREWSSDPLLDWGFRWIVLHERELEEPERGQLRKHLDALLGPGEDRGEVRLYDLAAASER